MLKRSIDFDLQPTLEERIFHHAKRLCVGFAIVAVTISALDLMNIRPVEAAAEMIQDKRISAAEIPSAVLAGIRTFSLSGDTTEVTVLIPRDVFKLPEHVASAPSAPTPSVAPTIRVASIAPMPILPPAAPVPSVAAVPASHVPAIAELAEAREQDAVEVAMAAPEPNVTTPPPAKAAPVQLASLGPTTLPSTAEQPAVAAPVVSLPAVLSVLPPPAPGVPPPSPIERLHLQGKALARAERCLANAIYFEARDQPFRGQVAVAQVVINRVFSGFYPEDVCGVVYQNADHHLACQFTFACDGKRKIVNERSAWARANRIARETLAGKMYEPAVGTATHYHAFYVRPNWVREMHKLVRYGEHSFYRPIAWGNGSDEPVWSKLALKKKKETR